MSQGPVRGHIAQSGLISDLCMPGSGRAPPLLPITAVSSSPQAIYQVQQYCCTSSTVPCETYPPRYSRVPSSWVRSICVAVRYYGVVLCLVPSAVTAVRAAQNPFTHPNIPTFKSPIGCRMFGTKVYIGYCCT